MYLINLCHDSVNIKGFLKHFHIDDSDPNFNRIANLDLKKISQNPKLSSTKICNYFQFSETLDSNDGTMLVFRAQYDESEIWANQFTDNGRPIISFDWQVYYHYLESDDYSSTLEKIINEVIPDLIDKLLHL